MTTTLAPPIPVTAASPYKFLDYFEERDKDKFAGRQRDIDEVLARIARARTFVLFGRSGLGKTSLLLAGIFPGLRQQNSLPIYVRTLKAPLRDLFAAVSNEAEGRPCKTMDDLREILGELSERGPVVLVLDQFEEFFIRFRDRPADRAEFIDGIAEVAHNLDLDLRIVFSLREDFLAELGDFRTTLPELFENEYRLLPLTAFGAREAIVRPLIYLDITYSRSLVTRMIDELSEVGFDPPLLQIFCTEVYLEAVRHSDGVPCLEESDLTKVGGLDGIFQRYLDGVVKSIPPERMLLTRAVLEALMTREETKRAATLESMMQEAEFTASQAEILQVLDMLCSHRLVRREWRDGQDWYELTHERLVPLVKEWLELDRDYFNFRVAKDLVANSSRGKHWLEMPETLLNNGQLKDIVWPYRQRLRLDEVEAEFLLRSTIYNNPERENVTFWAGELDKSADQVDQEKKPTSHEILGNMLSSADEGVRERAATAARHFPDPEHELVRRLLGMARTDTDESVRHAAGQSVGTLCSELDRKALPMNLFKGLGTRRGDLDVLADLLLGGLDISFFSRSQRFRARWRARKRTLSAQGDLIRQRGAVGGIVGLFAGLLWVFSSGAAFAVFLRFTFDTEACVTAIALLVLLPFGLAFGAFCGWRSSVNGAKDAVLNGEGRWGRILLKSPSSYLFLITILTGSLWYLREVYLPRVRLGNNLESLPLIWFWMSGLVIMLTILVNVSGTLQCIRPCVLPTQSLREVWPWALILSTCVPLLIPALISQLTLIFGVWEGGEKNQSELTGFAGYSSIAIAVVSSFLAFVYASSLGFGVAKMPAAATTVPRFRTTWGTVKSCRVLGAAGACFALYFCSVFFVLGHRLKKLEIAPNSQPSSSGAGPIQTIEMERQSTLRRTYGAISKKRKEIAAQPDSAKLRSELGDALERVGDLEAAAAEYRLAVEREPQNPQFRSSMAWTLCLLNRFEEALPHAREAARLLPDDANIQDTLAHAEFGTKNYDRAVHAWEAAKKAKPGYMSDERRIDCLRDKQHLEIARLIVKRNEVAAQPDSAKLRSELGDALERVGDLEAAAAEYRLAVEREPQNPQFRSSMAWTLCLLNRYEEALPHAREAARLLPDDANIQDTLAHAEFGTKNYDRAVHAWEAAKKAKPGYMSDERRIDCLRDKQHLKIARLIVKKRNEVAAQPDSAKLRSELGDALERVGDLEAAAAEYRLAVEREPKNPQFRNSLAWTLCLLNRYEEALPHAREAARLLPDDANIQDTLAHAEFGTKNYDRAVHAWEAVLKAKPGYMSDKSHVHCLRDKQNLETARSRVSESTKKAAHTP